MSAVPSSQRKRYVASEECYPDPEPESATEGSGMEKRAVRKCVFTYIFVCLGMERKGEGRRERQIGL